MGWMDLLPVDGIKKTALGSVLDPFADKFLLTTALIGLTIRHTQLIWLIVPIVSRDIILSGGTLLIFVSGGKIEIKPNIFGKITTFCQIVMVIFALSLECTNRTALIQSIYFEIWTYITVVVTLYSGYTYVLKGVQWLHEQTTKP